MVKRRSNVSGLSRFVQEAFGEHAVVAAPIAQPRLETTTSVQTNGSSTQAEEKNESSLTNIETRPSKKRKIGLLGPGHEKYDATGLVPFYTHVSEVPEHLQKCIVLSTCMP